MIGRYISMAEVLSPIAYEVVAGMTQVIEYYVRYGTNKQKKEKQKVKFGYNKKWKKNEGRQKKIQQNTK